MSDDATKKFPGSENESSDPLNIGNRIGTLIGLVQTMGASLEDVKGRLYTLEKTVSERLFDTKPIWERALAEIVELRSEQGQTRSELSQVRSELSQMRSEVSDSLHKFGEKIDLLVEDVFAVRSENKSLKRRMDNLEPKAS